MPSSKGKPNDPKLREKVKEEVKAETNKDGGGKGQWSAWKAAKLSKEYEKQGGGYENEAGSKNEPKKGTPEPKPSDKKKSEIEAGKKSSSLNGEKGGEKDEEVAPASAQKPKANMGKKKDQASNARKEGNKSDAKIGKARKQEMSKGKEKKSSEGTRKSSRIAGKRKINSDDDKGSAAKKQK